MPAYVIAFVTVTDPGADGRLRLAGRRCHDELRRPLPLRRSRAPRMLDGDFPGNGTAIIEFPSREDALRWYDSPEYQALRRAAPGGGPERR